MRRTIVALAGLTIVLSLALPGNVVPHASAQTGTWVTKAPIPIARTAAAAVTGNDGRIYVFGGSDNATRDFRDAEVYDPAANTWTAIAPLPVAEAYMSAQLANNGKIYLFGGFDNVAGRSLDNVFAYDPATNTYACSASYSGCASTSLAPMPAARSVMAIAMSDDGRIWTIGGFDGVPVATVEVYDPASNTWTEGPSLPSPDAGATAFAWIGWIVVNGGFDGQQDISTSYLLNPNPPPAGAFTPHLLPANEYGVTFPPEFWFCNHEDPAATLKWVDEHITDPEVYKKYFKKTTETSPIARFQLDLLTKGRPYITYDQFQQIINKICRDEARDLNGGTPPVAALREQAAALDPLPTSVSMAPAVYVGGVDSGGVSSSVGVYDWFHGTVTAGPDLPGPRELAAETYDDNGTLYVIGGDDGYAAYNTVLAYSPPLISIQVPASPTPTPTATLPAPTATPTPTPTSTPAPTATPTPVPLFVHISVAHHTIAAGKKQTISVQTLPGARVSFVVTYPSGKRAHHTSNADAQGLATWSYKQPNNVWKGTNRRARVAVTAGLGAGATVQAQATYTIR